MIWVRYSGQAAAREGGREEGESGWRWNAISRGVVAQWGWQWCARLHSVVTVVLTTMSAVERREGDEGRRDIQLVRVILGASFELSSESAPRRWKLRRSSLARVWNLRTLHITTAVLTCETRHLDERVLVLTQFARRQPRTRLAPLVYHLDIPILHRVVHLDRKVTVVCSMGLVGREAREGNIVHPVAVGSVVLLLIVVDDPVPLRSMQTGKRRRIVKHAEGLATRTRPGEGNGRSGGRVGSIERGDEVVDVSIVCVREVLKNVVDGTARGLFCVQRFWEGRAMNILISSKTTTNSPA
jgi:hypothetical protein